MGILVKLMLGGTYTLHTTSLSDALLVVQWSHPSIPAGPLSTAEDFGFVLEGVADVLVSGFVLEGVAEVLVFGRI